MGAGRLPPAHGRVGGRRATLEQLAERAEQTGVDVVCITDHNVTSAAVAAAERDLGVRVIVGEEIRNRACACRPAPASSSPSCCPLTPPTPATNSKNAAF
jgi:hypothetical protein